MFSLRHRFVCDLVSLQIVKRYKSRKLLYKEKLGCIQALKHFDDFYKSIFKNKWPSVRLALLSEEKTMAIVNNFGDVEVTEKLLQSQGALNFRTVLEDAKMNLVNSKKKRKKGESDQSKVNLNKVIEKYASEKEEEEMHFLYPEKTRPDVPIEFIDKDELKQSRNSNEQDDDEYVYSPEHTMTSLQHDITKAQIEKDRLILPDSMSNEASLHEFVPATKLRSLNEYISESEYYKFYQGKSEISINIEKEENINFPERLRVYTFDRGDVSTFPEPTRCTNNVYNFYELNGADLLVVLALDLQHGDTVLDMCSPSGDKAFCIFQSLMAKILACNNNKMAENLFRNYLYHYTPVWKDLLLMDKVDCSSSKYADLFNKILVDVPCTDDRLSLSDTKNNIFLPRNLKQRFELLEYQSSLLVKALKAINSGGTVVYSTSTLSPIQNDGIVAEALKTVWLETKMEFTIVDLSPALEHFSGFFRFGRGLNLKYGTLVLPFIPNNFGPRYLCKLVRK